jgi:hypothetical protein
MPYLRRNIWNDGPQNDGQPSRDPENFSVMDDKLAVGRIYRTTGGARGEGYAWFIYESSRRGFAPTRDQAAAEWKAAYELEKGHAVLLGGPVMAPSESGNEGLPSSGEGRKRIHGLP